MNKRVSGEGLCSSRVRVRHRRPRSTVSQPARSRVAARLRQNSVRARHRHSIGGPADPAAHRFPPQWLERCILFLRAVRDRAKRPAKAPRSIVARAERRWLVRAPIARRPASYRAPRKRETSSALPGRSKTPVRATPPARHSTARGNVRFSPLGPRAPVFRARVSEMAPAIDSALRFLRARQPRETCRPAMKARRAGPFHHLRHPCK